MTERVQHIITYKLSADIITVTCITYLTFTPESQKN